MIFRKLSQILSLWFVVIFFLPLLTFLLLGNFYAEKFFRHVAYQNLQTLANKQVEFINYWFSEKLDDLSLIAKHPQVKAKDIREMESYFRYILSNYRDYASIVFVDSNGKTLVDLDSQIGVDLSDRPYFKAAQEGKAYISDILIGRTSGKPIIIFSVPVFRGEEFQGLVFGSVEMAKISQIMQTDKNYQGQETFLLNKEGYMITESKHYQQLSKMGLLKESCILNKKLTTLGVRKALSGESSVGEYQDYLGKEVLGAYYWLPERQWVLIAKIDKEEAFTPLYQYYKLTIFGFLILSFVLLVLFNLFLFRRVANPLHELADMTAQIAAGNFTMRVKKFSEGSEIGILADSFNRMVDSLQKQEQINRKIVQQLEEKNKKLKTLAILDGLTGLYNKGYLLNRLESEFQHTIRYQKPIAIVMLDIDHFKRVNDTYGHLTGDKILRDLAAVILKSVRKADIVARYGGEEFTIVAPHTNLEQGLALAENVRKTIEESSFEVEEGIILPLTISLGVAVFQGTVTTDIANIISKVIEEADQALYQAKAKGRNRVEFASR